MALDTDDAAIEPLNDTLHQTERMMDPQLRATEHLPESGQIVTPAAYQRTLAAVREALFGHIQRRPISPSLLSVRPSSDAAITLRRRRVIDEAEANQHAQQAELPAPAPLPAQYVRLAHVPRDPRQSPVNSATAMMRTWVLVNDPPPLPPFEERNNPRPPLAIATCCICMDEKWPCEVVFTGCGHMNTCLPCAQKLVKSAESQTVPCPLCRVKSHPVLVRVG